MFRSQLPRLYELKDLINDPASPDAYFQNFDAHLMDSAHIMSIYVRWEGALQSLDTDAWECLKNEASPRLMASNKRGRGWQGLFDILNQAHAYNYLKRIGCTGVVFVPRTKTKTPDLEGWIDGGKILCEVKTLNISDDEIQGRRGGIVRNFAIRLEAGFFGKLRDAIAAAQHQMCVFDTLGSARHMVYVSPCFDDFLGECKEEYFRQIDDHLVEHPFDGIEIVMHNAHTPFHMPIFMKAARVDNAPQSLAGD
jgi:hypothetical protein